MTPPKYIPTPAIVLEPHPENPFVLMYKPYPSYPTARVGWDLTNAFITILEAMQDQINVSTALLSALPQSAWGDEIISAGFATLTIMHDAAQNYGFYMNMVKHATIATSEALSVLMPTADNYRLRILTMKTPSSGILDCTFPTHNTGEFVTDLYDASGVYNHWITHDFTNQGITESGHYSIGFQCSQKNASSSGFDVNITKVIVELAP